MQIELSPDDVQFLRQHLTRHLEEVENELVHTDARKMQRDIAADARRLRSILDKIPAS
jgi:hypothetical protein